MWAGHGCRWDSWPTALFPAPQWVTSKRGQGAWPPEVGQGRSTMWQAGVAWERGTGLSPGWLTSERGSRGGCGKDRPMTPCFQDPWVAVGGF